MRSPARTHSPLNGRPLGLLLVACAIAFNAFFLAPELRISRAPLNDLVFHRAASERLEASLEHGEPFLDPWVSEWSLGYPLWRSYQPLAHLLGALVLRFGRSFGEPSAVFAALLYILLVAFPSSVYLGGRWMGLSPPAAGLAALLAFASSSAGDLDGYGLGYGSSCPGVMVVEHALARRGRDAGVGLRGHHRREGHPGLPGQHLDAGGGAAPGAQVSVASVMATCAAAGLGLRDLPSPLERRLLTGRASPEARSRSVPSSPRARSAG